MQFFPPDRQKCLRIEMDLEDILKDPPDFQDPEIDRSNPRYALLAKQRQCQVCGIVGNRLFREVYQGKAQFALYAETREKPDGELHLILMTVDHIQAKRRGGLDTPENRQVLCALCNYLKDVLDGHSEVDRKRLRRVLDLSRYINKSRSSRKRTEHNLSKRLRRAAQLRRTITAITANLDRASIQSRVEMLRCREILQKESGIMEDQIGRTLLASQTKGEVYEDLLPRSDE